MIRVVIVGDGGRFVNPGVPVPCLPCDGASVISASIWINIAPCFESMRHNGALMVPAYEALRQSGATMGALAWRAGSRVLVLALISHQRRGTLALVGQSVTAANVMRSACKSA